MLESEIKCFAQQAGFDLVSNDGSELLLRKVRKNSRDGVQYLRKMGKLPRLSREEPSLKLKEIIRFLKIHNHGTM